MTLQAVRRSHPRKAQTKMRRRPLAPAFRTSSAVAAADFYARNALRRRLPSL